MADGSVVFSTELDTGGLRSGLSGIEKSASKWTAGIGKAFSFATISAAVAKLGKIGIEYNAQMESYVTNFGVMLGDEAKALEHVAELRDMAAKTPFGMEDLASASQTMLSFGMDAEYSMEAMKQLGDISLGNKERFSSLALAFSQVSAAGKLSGQDLLQMVNAGFNPLNTIAEATGTNLADLKEVMGGGKGSKEFQKAMKAAKKEVARLGDQASEGAKMLAQIGEEGMISAEMVGIAMEMETSPGGRFYQGMEKASQTMSGLWSTLQDDAKQLVGNVFEPVGDVLSQHVLPAAIKAVGALNNLFDPKYSQVEYEARVDVTSATENLATLDEKISSLKDKFLTDVIQIKLDAKEASDLLEELEQFQGIEKSLLSDADKQRMVDITKALVDMYPELEKYVGKDGILTKEADAVRDLTTEYQNLAWAKATAEYTASLDSAYAKALLDKELLETRLDGLKEEQKLLIERDKAEAGLQLAASYAQYGISSDPAEQKQYLDTLQQYVDLGYDIESMSSSLAESGFSLGELFKDDGSGNVLDSVDGEKLITLQAAMDYIANALRPENSQTQEAAATLGEDIAAAEAALAESEATLAELLAQKETYDQLLAEIQSGERVITIDDLFSDTPSETPTGDGPMTRAVKADGDTAVDTVGAKARAVKEKIKSELAGGFSSEGSEGSEGTEAGGTMTKLGEQIVMEIGAGIESGSGTAKATIVTLVSSMKNAANPKQFVSVGQQIAYGIAQGIRSGTSAVAGAVMALIKVALDTASKAAEINSPSRLFKRVIGLAIPEGVAAGIDAGTYMAVDSVNRMVAASVPDGSRIASQIMSKSASFNGASGSAIAAAAANGNFTQNNTFNVPVQTPDEFAKTMRLYATYGLQG